MYSCHLFLISSASVISVLYSAHLCIKYSPGISSFLEEISSLSHSVVYPYFYALISEEGFLISLLFSGTCIQMDISVLFSLFFASFLFTAPLTAWLIASCSDTSISAKARLESTKGILPGGLANYQPSLRLCHLFCWGLSRWLSGKESSCQSRRCKRLMFSS